VFAPYTVVRELGRGTHGLVLQARAPDGRDVAIKLLMAPSPERRRRFDRERQTMAQLDETAGFVPLLDVLETAQGPCLILPFFPGGTLRDRLRAGPPRVHEAIRLGRKLATAMGRAHALGIVHRDLKPENILFGATGEPLIADLGLAKHWGESLGVTNSLSRSGELRGTAGYMAPEQAADAKSAGPAADVFSLGAIIYELLAGDSPFRGEGQLDVLAKSRRGEFEPLTSANPDVPRWLAEVVERCLAADPAKRFEDGAALSVALLQGTMRRSTTGRGPLVAAAGVAVVLAVAGLVLATRPDEPAVARADPLEPPEPVPTATEPATEPVAPVVVADPPSAVDPAVVVTPEAPEAPSGRPTGVIAPVMLRLGSLGPLEDLVKLGTADAWQVSRPDGTDLVWENRAAPAAIRYLYARFGTNEPRRIMIDVTVEELDPKLPPFGAGIIYDFDPPTQTYYAIVVDAKDTVTLYRRQPDGLRPQWSRKFGPPPRGPVRRQLEVFEEESGFEILTGGERLMELGRKGGTRRIGEGGLGFIVMGAGRFTIHGFDAVKQ
jgi:serine/threonine-protein kinase